MIKTSWKLRIQCILQPRGRRRFQQDTQPSPIDGSIRFTRRIGATNNSLTYVLLAHSPHDNFWLFWGLLGPISSPCCRFHHAKALHFLHEGPALLQIWRWAHPLPSLHCGRSEKTTKSHLLRPLVKQTAVLAGESCFAVDGVSVKCGWIAWKLVPTWEVARDWTD